MPVAVYPPFPDDVPIAQLSIVDYTLLKAGNVTEIEKLWDAATQVGFWYLKNHGVEEEVQGMFEMGEETFDLPLEEKMKFEQGDDGISAGYKALGTLATDDTGSKDRVEFINVAQDDALSYPLPTHRTYPSTVNARMKSTVIPFVRKSSEVNLALMGILNDKLGLPKGMLESKHAIDEHSGSETRCIRSPKYQEGQPEKAALGAHTDFGSMTFLHNRLGGLQVMLPGTTDWKYVKPVLGHAICNLGDAMNIFSAGILRSGLHRIVNPPKNQFAFDRWSCAFFTRPGNSVILEPLVESPAIANARNAAPVGKYGTGATAAEWFVRRTKANRMNNREGPESWRASRGTEHYDDSVKIAAQQRYLTNDLGGS